MTTEDSPVLLALHGQIQTLADIQTRLQALRQIPARLLRPQTHLPLSLHDSTTIPPALRIQDLKDVAESLLSDVVQDALKAAKGSEKARGIVINDTKRGSKKRRRSLSPVSVKPYISFESSSSPTLSSSLWPPPTGPPFDEPPIRAQDLPQFIREFNKANAETPCRLRVYRPHSSAAQGVTLGSPVVVRFTIKDIMTVYVTLTDEEGGRGRGGDDRGALVVQTVTAFGPREQKRPHSYSEYTSYQVLSQQIAKMIDSDSRVSLQTLVNLLQSYTGLFVHQCTVCGRVLSAESHIPPVARIWILKATGPSGHVDDDDAAISGDGAASAPVDGALDTDADRKQKGRWEPRHVACLGA